jgi:hypothetical protein
MFSIKTLHPGGFGTRVFFSAMSTAPRRQGMELLDFVYLVSNMIRLIEFIYLMHVGLKLTDF